jgi:iron complex transport system substrate-binding protein
MTSGPVQLTPTLTLPLAGGGKSKRRALPPPPRGKDGEGVVRRFARSLALICVLVSISAPASAAAAPERVVSFNICADQLVTALADPAQIVGLSPYAADPTLSAVAEQAKQFPRIEWQAESTIPLRPDLVLIGHRDRSATQRLLSALGYRVEEVELVNTIGQARAQITQVAAWLGQPQRGEALLQRLDAARARLAAAPRPAASTAMLVERSGYAEGPASLAAAMIAEAGLHPPPGGPAGLGGFVPLERLVTLRPDLLVLHGIITEAHDQGAVYLAHPALAALYPPSRRLVLPERYTLCGGPALVAGFEYLAAELRRLAADNN